MARLDLITLSVKLDTSGLIWLPEIGDEVSPRTDLERVSILVDPQGLTPTELRERFVWLPTVEQMVEQFEARQAVIYHAGVTEMLRYEAVVRISDKVIETCEATLRLAFGKALHELLSNHAQDLVH